MEAFEGFGLWPGFSTFTFLLFLCDLLSALLQLPSLSNSFLCCCCFPKREKTMWYLCVFFHRLLDYRKPEVESLAQLFGATEDPQNGDVSSQLQWKLPHHYHADSPFHFVNLPSEQLARNIATRSRLFFPRMKFSFLICGSVLSFDF